VLLGGEASTGEIGFASVAVFVEWPTCHGQYIEARRARAR
jgi:hypothetical protein